MIHVCLDQSLQVVGRTKRSIEFPLRLSDPCVPEAEQPDDICITAEDQFDINIPVFVRPNTLSSDKLSYFQEHITAGSEHVQVAFIDSSASFSQLLDTVRQKRKDLGYFFIINEQCAPQGAVQAAQLWQQANMMRPQIQ